MLTTISRTFLFIFASIANSLNAQDLTTQDQLLVKNFIELIHQKKSASVSRLVKYPLDRPYPLPDIVSPHQFEQKFDTLFDDFLQNSITKSQMDSDWRKVGWRGIMLNSGLVWLDAEGNLLAINYLSDIEKEHQQKLATTDRTKLHESLKNFLAPVLILETKKFRIRVDELANGTFRYASWSITSDMSSKPDLILIDGQWRPEGSGGNSTYYFKNGAFTYECFINRIRGHDQAPAYLTVFKNNEEILNQSATQLYH